MEQEQKISSEQAAVLTSMSLFLRFRDDFEKKFGPEPATDYACLVVTTIFLRHYGLVARDVLENQREGAQTFGKAMAAIENTPGIKELLAGLQEVEDRNVEKA